jgi:hypothetical protein
VTEEIFKRISSAITEQKDKPIYSPGMTSDEYAIRACYAEGFTNGANAIADAYNGLNFKYGDEDE